jgi:hypothetical protein
MINYSLSILITSMTALASIAGLSAYPNQLYIKNDSGLKLYFIADWQRDTPKTTAEYWGSLGDRIEEILPYQIGQIQEIDKAKTYALIKVSPVDWEPAPKLVGQRRPSWSTFQFKQDCTGPMYLIYSNAGFRTVTPREWDMINQSSAQQIGKSKD